MYFHPPSSFGKYAHSTLLGVNVICLLVMYTNKVLGAAICLRQTKLLGLRSLRRKMSEGARGGGGRWSAAHASGADFSKHVILDIGSPCAPSKRDPLNSEVMLAVRVSAAPVSCSLSPVPADFPHPNCVIPRSG